MSIKGNRVLNSQVVFQMFSRLKESVSTESICRFFVRRKVNRFDCEAIEPECMSLAAEGNRMQHEHPKTATVADPYATIIGTNGLVLKLSSLNEDRLATA